MKIIIDIGDALYPEVGEQFVEAGSTVTVRDVGSRIAWRGTVDGYKKDGRASQLLFAHASEAAIGR